MTPLPGARPLHEYRLIVDARTPKEFADDHLPGALNLPIVTQEEFAEVGTLHRSSPHQAYVIGAQYALRNVARYIGEVFAPLPARSRVLVYCFRGGKRSNAFADPLRSIGYQVDVLPGGWKAYRAWVRAELASRPSQHSWRVLSGSTASGKTRLLQALASAGAQVLDLEALACHRGSLLGGLPDQAQPPQKAFDSRLLQALQGMDTARPIWVEDESKRIGRLQLPDTLFHAIQQAPSWQLQVPMADRVRACHEDYPHLAREPLSLVQQLQPLKPMIGGAPLAHWQQLAEAGDVDALFEAVMRQHYDPCYARSSAKQRANAQPLQLPEHTLHEPAALARVAAQLLG